MPWLLCTFLGYVLFLNLLRPFRPTELLDFDDRQENDLRRPETPFSPSLLTRLQGEHTIGSIVFAALNLLLIFFLITDFIYLLDPSVVTHGEYSSAVHQGVYALMFSIVIAIGIILFIFRGDLNFFEQNHQLKRLTYVWILLNVILVLFTSYKNWAYVEALGLTYKRIGVFVYLLLTLIGLLTAYLKVSRTKSFVYLIRTNVSVWFAVLVLSTAIPWAKMITSFNLEQLDNPDVAYLIELAPGNLEQLYRYSKSNGNKLILEQKLSIEDHYRDYRDEQDGKTWQEYTWYNIAENLER